MQDCVQPGSDCAPFYSRDTTSHGNGDRRAHQQQHRLQTRLVLNTHTHPWKCCRKIIWMMHRLIERCDNTHPDASDGKQTAGTMGDKTRAHKRGEKQRCGCTRSLPQHSSQGPATQIKPFFLSRIASSSLWMFNMLMFTSIKHIVSLQFHKICFQLQSALLPSHFSATVTYLYFTFWIPRGQKSFIHDCHIQPFGSVWPLFNLISPTEMKDLLLEMEVFQAEAIPLSLKKGFQDLSEKKVINFSCLTELYL